MSEFDVTSSTITIQTCTIQASEEDRHDQMLDAASRFEAMTPEQARQVFDKLNEDGTLRELVSDLTADGSGGSQGLSADEQAVLFTTLASKLTGTQLATLANTIRDPHALDRLGEVLIESDAASPGNLAEFLRDFKVESNLSAQEHQQELLPFVKVGWKQEAPRARLAANMLCALASAETSRPAFQAAVAHLQHNGNLDRVLAAGFGRYAATLHIGSNTYFGRTEVGVLRSAPLQAILEAASQTDGKTKGAVVCAVSSALEDKTRFNIASADRRDPLALSGVSRAVRLFHEIAAVTPNDLESVPCDLGNSPLRPRLAPPSH